MSENENKYDLAVKNSRLGKVVRKLARRKELLRKSRFEKLVVAAFKRGYEAGVTDGQLLGQGVYVSGIGFVLGLQDKEGLARLFPGYGYLPPPGLSTLNKSTTNFGRLKVNARNPDSAGFFPPKNFSGRNEDSLP